MAEDLGFKRRRAGSMVAVNTGFCAEDFGRLEELELSPQDLRHIILCDRCRRAFVEAWDHVYGTRPNCRNLLAGFGTGDTLPSL